MKSMRLFCLLRCICLCAVLCGALRAFAEDTPVNFDRQAIYNAYLNGDLATIRKSAETLTDLHPLPDTPGSPDPYADEHAFVDAVFALEDLHTELPLDYDYASVPLQTEQMEREGEVRLNTYIRTALENNANLFYQDAADPGLYRAAYPAYLKAFNKYKDKYNDYAARYLNMLVKQLNYPDGIAEYLRQIRLLDGAFAAHAAPVRKSAAQLPSDDNRRETAALCTLFNDPGIDAQPVRFAKSGAYLVAQNQSEIVCLKDGSVLWRKRVPVTSARIAAGNSQPLIHGDCVYLLQGGRLTAYNLARGGQRWTAPANTYDCAGPVLYRGMLLTARAETGRANVADTLKLALLDPDNGRTVVSRTLLTNLDDPDPVSRARGEWMLGGFVVDGDLLYVYHRDGIVFAFDLARCMPLWARRTDRTVTLGDLARCGEIPLLFRDDAPFSVADANRLFVKHPAQKVIHVLDRATGKLLRNVPAEIGRAFADGDTVYLLSKDGRTLHSCTIPADGEVAHHHIALPKRAEIVRELSGKEHLALFMDSAVVCYDPALREIGRYALPEAFRPVGVADGDLYGASPSGHLFLRSAATHADLPADDTEKSDYLSELRELRSGRNFVIGMYEMSRGNGIHTLYAPGENTGTGLLMFTDPKLEKGFSMTRPAGMNYAENAGELFTISAEKIAVIDRKSGSRIGLHRLTGGDFDLSRVQCGAIGVHGGELFFCAHDAAQGDALFAANRDRVRKVCTLPCAPENVAALLPDCSKLFALNSRQLVQYALENGEYRQISAAETPLDHAVCKVRNNDWLLLHDTARPHSAQYLLCEVASGKSYAVTLPEESPGNARAEVPPTLAADGYFLIGRLDTAGNPLWYALHLKSHKLLELRARSLPAVFDGKLYAVAGCGEDVPGAIVADSTGNLACVVFGADGEKISEHVLPQLITNEMQEKIGKSKKPEQQIPILYHGSGTFRHDGKIYHLLTQFRRNSKYFGVTYLARQDADGSCALIPLPYFESELFLLALTDGASSLLSCDGRTQMSQDALMTFALGDFKPIETRLVSNEFELKQDGFPDEFPDDAFVKLGNGNEICVLRHKNNNTFFALRLRDPAALRLIADMKSGDQLRAETFRDVSGLIERMRTGRGDANTIRRVWLIDPNVDSSKYLHSNPLKGEIVLEFELACYEPDYLPTSFYDRFGDDFFELILYKTDGTTIPLLSLGTPYRFPGVVHRTGRDLRD